MKRFLALLTCLAVLLVLVNCTKTYSGKPQPKAVKGILDLCDWNFEREGPVQLDGKWEFYWKRFILPDALKPEANQPESNTGIRQVRTSTILARRTNPESTIGLENILQKMGLIK